MEQNKKELVRQSIHIIAGMIAIAVIMFFGKQAIIIIFSATFLVTFALFYIHNKIRPIKILEKIVEKAEREKEKHYRGIAAIRLSASLLICSILFYLEPKTTLIGAIIVLTIGDSTSTIAGKTFGRTSIQDKTLEGTIAGIIVSTAILSIILSLEIALIVSIVGMFAEYLPMDDNYTVPIIAGTTIALLT